MKVKFLGVPKGFVGTEFLQDLKGLCELKCQEYWTQAQDTLTPNDEKVLLEEVLDADHEQVAHLPYREVVGVISYPTGDAILRIGVGQVPI